VVRQKGYGDLVLSLRFERFASAVRLDWNARLYPLRPQTFCNLILTHVTGKKHPKLPRFSTLFKGLARDPKIPSCIHQVILT
jgi:hypothetical protein